MNLALFLHQVYLKSLRTTGLLFIGAASLKTAHAISSSGFYTHDMQAWTMGAAYLGFSGQPEQAVNLDGSFTSDLPYSLYVG